MELNYNITEDDYIAYNVFHYENAPAYRKQMTAVGLVTPVLLIVIGFVAKGTLDLFTCAVSAIFLVIWFGFGKKRRTKIMERSVKKLVGNGDFNEFIGLQKLVLHEEDFVVESPGKITATSYNAVQKILCDDKRIYVYVGSVSAFIVPFSAFESPTQKEEFVAFITSRAKNLQAK